MVPIGLGGRDERAVQGWTVKPNTLGRYRWHVQNVAKADVDWSENVFLLNTPNHRF